MFSALVYVAARAPDGGEDYTELAKTFPTPPATAGIVFDGNEGRLSEQAFLRDFAGDLPKAKAKVLYAAQQPIQKALLPGKTMNATWRSKPSYYAVSTEDRTINPDLERFMAKRMAAKTIEVKASHLSLISHSDEITHSLSKPRDSKADGIKARSDPGAARSARTLSICAWSAGWVEPCETDRFSSCHQAGMTGYHRNFVCRPGGRKRTFRGRTR
jgi:hypothetical protein